MNLGYMINAFGPLVGDGGGVTNIKDVHYLTLCDLDDTLAKISKVGYKQIEMFDGNLLQYEGKEEELKKLLNKYDMSILGIYFGAFYIYEDVLKEELIRLARACKMAQALGIKHVVLGGGSVRAAGIKEEDYIKLGKALDEANEVVSSYGLVASYHPHLGSIAEHPEQIEKVFNNTSVAFCPDIAHLVAGGGDALELIKRYKDRIKYVHLKDLSDAKEFVPLGKGSINLDDIISFLKSNDYKGDWLVEIDGYSGDPVEACETSMQFLKGKL